MEWLFLVPIIIVVAVFAIGGILVTLPLLPGQNPAWALQVESYLSHWSAGLRRSPHLRRGLISGAVAGTIVAAAMVIAAWSHNPMGAVHGAGGVSLLVLVVVALSWFIVAGAAVSTLVAAASAGRQRLRGPAA